MKSLIYHISKYLQVFFKPRMFALKRNYQGEKINGVRIGNTTFIDHSTNLIIEDLVYIGHYNFIEASQGIKLGNGCQITSYVNITTHSSHQSIRLYGSSYSKVSNHIGYERGSIEIGEFTFVGPFCVIMPHTKIGKGSVVAAHSYVKGDFPDFSIIAGNPAKVVGDVREKDNKILSEYPELKNNYMV
jgi:acetyltransferase-like isoleucine patch superfamily enzyme